MNVQGYSNSAFNKTNREKSESFNRSAVSNSLQLHGLYVAHQAPLSMGSSRQEYCSGLPCLFPGNLSRPRDWTRVSHIAGRFFTIWAIREAIRKQFNWLSLKKAKIHGNNLVNFALLYIDEYIIEFLECFRVSSWYSYTFFTNSKFISKC